MSLQLAAQHLADKGRGPDTTLVHMSNKEVKSLNDLAMAHGGHLTINPQTGLPEAGFLSAILPMVAGAALASTGVGAPMAAMMIGGGSYLLNPKAGLMGGLMAGLGAYGGYGFGEGLTNLGATSEAGLTSTGGSMDYAAQNAEAIKNAQAFEQAKLAQAAQTNAQALENAKYFTDYGAPVNEFAQVSSGLPTSPGGIEVAASTPARPPIGVDFEQQAELMNRDNLLRNPLTQNQLGQSATGFDAMKRGAQSLINDPTGEKFKTLGGGSYMGLAKQGLAAAAPVASEGLKTAGLNVPTTQQKQQVVPHYRFSPGMVSPTPAAGATGTENTYFKPSYTALSDADAASLYPGYPAAQAANGGMMGYAPGGDIQEDPYRTTPDDSLETAYAKAEEKNDTATMRAIEREMEIRDTNKAGMTKGLSGMKGLAMGGLSNARYNLGGYSDGGRLLRGPGDGGLMGYAGGGPVEDMSNNAMMGVNTMYPMANITTSSYGTPDQMATGGISGSGNLDLSIPLDFGGGAGGGGFGGGGANGYSAVGSGGGSQTPFAGQNNTSTSGLGVNPMADDSRMNANNGTFSDTFQPVGTHAFGGNPQQAISLLSSLMQGKQTGNASAQMASGGMATGGMATGGISDAGYNLGSYSDGGRLLRGPGDGVSDSIPAVIGKKQPARLADGEFVVPARIVSEIGNGSTEAGARKLYAMMDRIQAARGKTVGKGKVAKNTRADKYLPA